jgi:hypothetical protein
MEHRVEINVNLVMYAVFIENVLFAMTPDV